MKRPSQADRLYALLKDGKAHSTLEICEVVYGGSGLRLARVAARIKDLKDRGHEIKGWDEGDAFFYQLLNAPKRQEYDIVIRNGRAVAVLNER